MNLQVAMLRAHLRSCYRYATYRARLDQKGRSSLVASSEPAPDLVGAHTSLESALGVVYITTQANDIYAGVHEGTSGHAKVVNCTVGQVSKDLEMTETALGDRVKKDERGRDCLSRVRSVLAEGKSR